MLSDCGRIKMVSATAFPLTGEKYALADFPYGSFNEPSLFVTPSSLLHPIGAFDISP